MSAPSPKYVMLNDSPGNLIPPPQRRNLPPYQNPQHLHNPRSGGNCFLKCICCCYCFLFFLVIALTILAYVLYATFKPHVPNYKVDKFDVKTFNVLPDLSLNAEIAVTVKADNSNDHIGFKYGKDSAVIVTYTGKNLCSGKIPAFDQPPNNVSMINVELKGKTEFNTGLQETLMADKKAGKVPLTILVKVPVVVVLGSSFPLREVLVKINCSLVVDNLATDKKIGIISTKYDYHVVF